MTGRLFLLLAAGILTSCTGLPRPVVRDASASSPEAVSLLRQSAEKAGSPWQRLKTVDVSYAGNWSRIAAAVQPVLVDDRFRASSDERYEPARQRVTQRHRGIAGEKTVIRTPESVRVTRNGIPDTDEESKAAAALVADAYTIFTFGPAFLIERGEGWQQTGERSLAGERCALLETTLRPGIGQSPADAVIAWIGLETKRLHRVQFTLNGLASTAGADVDVTFSGFQPGPHGTEWPQHFIERIRRPFDVRAHTWDTIRLTATQAD